MREGMRIVGFVGVGQHAVGQRRLNRAAEQVRANYCRSLLASVGTGELHRHAARGQVDARDHGCEGVEYMMFGLLERFLWKRAAAGLAHVIAELRYDRT